MMMTASWNAWTGIDNGRYLWLIAVATLISACYLFFTHRKHPWIIINMWMLSVIYIFLTYRK